MATEEKDPHFQELGKRGWRARAEKVAAGYYSELGRRGGEATKKRGTDYYRAIGAKGGKTPRRVKMKEQQHAEQTSRSA